MLRNMNYLESYSIGASDSSMGHVKDFSFDDEAWIIHYFVVNIGRWLSNRGVLIARQWIKQVIWPGVNLSIDLTKQAVKNTPPQTRRRN